MDMLRQLMVMLCLGATISFLEIVHASPVPLDQATTRNNDSGTTPETDKELSPAIDGRASTSGDTITCNQYAGGASVGGTGGSTSNNCGLVKSGNCFSSDTIVKTVDGQEKTMAELRTGDKLQGMKNQDEMLTFLHAHQTEMAWFHTITTASGHQLSLTRHHLLATVATDGNVIYTAAENVHIGDHLLVEQELNNTFDKSPVITIVLEQKLGYYAPLTHSGTIVVNGIVASCYVGVKSHDDAHFAMAPFRLFYNIASWWSVDEPFETLLGQSLHELPKMMLQFGRIFRPSALIM